MRAELAEDAARELAAELERIVRARAGSQIEQLKVDVEGECIVLTGVARSYYAKQLATHAVLHELPEREVTNDIDVR